MEESPEFHRQVAEQTVPDSPLRHCVANHRGAIGRAFAISALGSITYYVGITYVPAFLTSAGALSEEASLWLSTIAAVMVADVAVIWSDLLEIALMNRLIDEGEVYTDLSEEAFADVQSNDDRQLVVTVVYTALSFVAVVFFIRWFWSAYWNLRPLGQPESRFHPAWAMVSWFIPIFNIWRPKQVANDIWRGSDPSGTTIAADAMSSSASSSSTNRSRHSIRSATPSCSASSR